MSTPVRLQTSVWNPFGARRALLLHGLTSDAGSWWRIASDLAEDDWMVVAPDLRSHGASPTGTDHQLTTMAGDVALLGDGWDLVVGHSLGGSIAAVLAAEQHVSSMVLIDPVLELRAASRTPLRASILASLQRRDAVEVGRANPRWDVRDVQRKVLAVSMVTPDVVEAVFDDNDPWDVRWTAPRWTGHVQLLAADPARGGLLSSSTLAEVSRDAHVDVAGMVVAGAGHSIHREQPGPVMEAIRAVVRSG